MTQVRPGSETAHEPPQRRLMELRLTEKALEGSHAAEALLGIAAAAMAIVGLSGVRPLTLGSVAMMVLGVALLFEGAATAKRYQKLSSIVPVREQEQAQVGGGLTVEVVGGAAGIALGLLALMGVEPGVLLPIGALVYGAAYVMSGGLLPALEHWVERGEAAEPGPHASGRRERISHRAVGAAAAARALAGIASAMLGILALAAVGPSTTLSLAALLALGIATIASASAFSARMSTLSHPGA